MPYQIDYSKFNNVTRNENGEVLGNHVHNVSEVDKETQKQFRQEFDQFTKDLIQNYNDDQDRSALRLRGMRSAIHNGVYYNKYFWNKIAFVDHEYYGICIWLGIDSTGIHLILGTAENDLADALNSTEINNYIKSSATQDIDSFEKGVHDNYLIYRYRDNNYEINIDDFENVLSYLVPVYQDTVNEFPKIGSASVTREDLLRVMADFTNGERPNYNPPRKHFFRIDGQDTIYPRKYIVLRARVFRNLDNTNYTTDQAKAVLDSVFGESIEHINNEQISNKKYFNPGDPLDENYKNDIDNGKNFWLLDGNLDSNILNTYITEARFVSTSSSSHQDNINKINVGDYVAIKHAYNTKNLPFNNKGQSFGVMDIEAIGIVTSNPKDSKSLGVMWDIEFIQKKIYFYAYYKNFQHINHKKWPEVPHWIFYGYNQSEEYLNSSVEQWIRETKKDQVMNLNTILYGPPGTGKTYATTKKALEIIDGKVYSDHNEAKKRFIELQDSGQIQMVTFHQSYGYEEFVEGLSADTINGQVTYKIKDGLFKKIVHEAKSLTNEIADNMEFDELYEKYLEKLSYIEDEKSDKVLKTVRGIEFELFRNTSSVVVRANSNTSISISKNALLQTIASGKAPYYTSYMTVVLDDILNGNQISVQESSKEKKYVLIIDEINRGNISKIFGELITLVEASKRLGAKDETRVLLPYSKVEFSIPSNLYIVGTMNTADRSIALLDTALRRRFDFEEMMPNIKLVRDKVGRIDGIDIARILEYINKRIEVLYDRDHMIGHAYLLDVTSFDELQAIMKNRIIPLLQEYFYDDWQKINMIFNNNGFIEENIINTSLFSKIDDADFDEEQKVYTLNSDALKDENMYKAIYE